MAETTTPAGLPVGIFNLAKVLTPQQFKADLAKQIRGFSKTKRRRFLRKVAGKVMENMVLIRFLRGGYKTVSDWKSKASATKFDGRWSVGYKKRPSGQEVTPDKIRMVDTKELANSYRILHADHNSVTVGPGKRGHGGAGEKIAEKEEKAGNAIVGFTEEINKALTYEMENYVHLVATGREPPYLPKSRIGRKSVSI